MKFSYLVEYLSPSTRIRIISPEGIGFEGTVVECIRLMRRCMFDDFYIEYMCISGNVLNVYICID